MIKKLTKEDAKKEKMKFEVVRILKDKKTGKYHCLFCFKKLKETKNPFCLECKKCKKYYGLGYCKRIIIKSKLQEKR